MSENAKSLMDFLESSVENTKTGVIQEYQYSHFPNFKRAVRELSALGLVRLYVNGSVSLP